MSLSDLVTDGVERILGASDAGLIDHTPQNTVR
jgi:hypothetical protein